MNKLWVGVMRIIQKRILKRASWQGRKMISSEGSIGSEVITVYQTEGVINC